MSEANAPRQLIVLCDGTNNNLTGGRNDTNLVRLAELFARHPNPQRLVHYDPGVGNPGEMPGASMVDKIKRAYDRIEGLAIGRGVFENIAEAYIFLMHNWRDERDRIFLFGFSRGAFTARSVAGLINRFGLLEPHLEVMVPTLLHHYFSAHVSDEKAHGDPKAQHRRDQHDAIAQQVVRLFAGGERAAPGQPANPRTRRVYVYFTGVWDTVAAVGLPPFALRSHARPTMAGKMFVHVRQALALDEYRAQFRQRLYLGDNSDNVPIKGGMTGTLKQLWFRGAHSDVGGYYPPGQTRLADRAMAWLVSEAVAKGLWIGDSAQVRNQGDAEREQAVLDALLQHGLSQGEPHALVHSELFDSPLWALAGLTQRETMQVVLDSGERSAITPELHPSVQAYADDPASRTQWTDGQERRLATPMAKAKAVLVVLACLLLPLYLGWVLSGGAFSPAEALRADLDFQRWQLSGLGVVLGSNGMEAWQTGSLAFVSPRWALLWDLFYIAAWASLLAFAVSWAFARVAGLRRPDQPPSPALKLLGWSLPVAVAADLLENAFGWWALTATLQDLAAIQFIGLALGLLAAVCSVVKLLGLAGVAALLIWGLLPSR